MFAEKQKLVADLEAYGAGHGGGAAPAPAAPAEAPAGLAYNAMSCHHISVVYQWQWMLGILLMIKLDAQKLPQKPQLQRLLPRLRKLLPPRTCLGCA